MTTEELRRQIKSGKMLPVYFFYGEEQYLLKKRVEDIEQKLVAPGMESFNRFRFDGKTTELETVLEAVEQFPQMSEKKTVVVTDGGYFNDARLEIFKRVCRAISELPDYVCLIFVETDFDGKKLAKNLKTIEEYGAVVRFEKIPMNEIITWVDGKLREAEKMIAPKDLNYFVRLCDGFLGNIESEFEKLMNYVGERSKVTREDIDAVVEEYGEVLVYEMTDSFLAGEIAKGQKQLHHLKSSKNYKLRPLAVYSNIMGKIADLLTCKQLKEAGMQPEEIGGYMEYYKSPYITSKIIKESRKFKEGQLTHLLKTGLNYETEIKTGQIDGWTATELLLAEISQITFR